MAQPERGLVLSCVPTPRGLFLRETSLASGKSRDLMSLDAHLASVGWGRTMLIDYRAVDGQPLKAALILPPSYRAGQRYPTITWVYAGIEHEKSANASIVETGPMRLGVPPYDDQALYTRNSPLSHVEQIETPLLLIHGEHDVRGAMSQAESLFYGLYRQGKTARLLRYWGESHCLCQSPANIRNVYDESVRWLDKYLGIHPSSGGY